MRSPSTLPADIPLTDQGEGPAERGAWSARTLEPTNLFWFSMLAASALGTNLGDFWADALSLGLWPAFATMALLALVAIGCDLRFGCRTEFFYWIAIVVLRAAATNIADFLTHEHAIDFLLVAALFGAASLAAAYFAMREYRDARSPVINPRYWGTMFLAGIFGTVFGDYVSGAIGVVGSAASLSLALVVVIWLRHAFFAASMVAYWCVIMAERSAGTPIGDSAQGDDGLNLGLPVSMACMSALLLAGLFARARLQKTSAVRKVATAA